MPRKTLLLLCAAAPLWLCVACGGDGSGDLTGSVTKTYDLDYDAVWVERQVKGGALQAIKISYVQSPEKQLPPKPVIVVVNAPVESGTQIDFSAPNKGSLQRAMPNGTRFPDIKTATIRFDSLGEVGENASGKFNVTFIDGHTLNGEFSATVKLLSAD